MTEQPTTPQAHGVRIEAQPFGARIAIDGQHIEEHVIAYQLEHNIRDGLPSLILHTREQDTVVWEGLARVAVATTEPPGETMANFLAGIDPAALERAALDRPDLDGGKHEVTAAILRQLSEWARGGDIR